ncbi:biotin transporter BioY [Streptomyces sp. NPDC001978]|uniref:biotin transporter BioY n=1 Tax=Streptomyces sp. NPDC001978 TaxID=3364627 RepID=UPI0036AA6DCD
MALAYDLPRQRPVLAESLLPRTLTRNGVTVALGTGLTALAAQLVVPIPGSPVPVTGQTFAVFLTAAALGPGRGLASQFLYLALGAIGLPVFTRGQRGVEVIFGATGGYLIGFLAAAAIMGYGARRGADRSPARAFPVLLLASAAIYLLGATWLSSVTGMSASETLSVGVVPFLLGDALKAVLAAAMLPAAWRVVGRIDKDGNE